MACPACGSEDAFLVDSKFLVTGLYRCTECRLLFRAPTTSIQQNRQFYQTAYRRGFTTELPSEQELSELMSKRFQGTGKNYGIYIAVLRAIGCRPGDTLLDFGCSWGYGSWQLAQAGFKVTGFEISRPRAEYAKRYLDLEVFTELAELSAHESYIGRFDVFFSCHVLEHVPSTLAVFDLAKRILRPGGLFVAFTPNGSDVFRQVDPNTWHGFWGRIHPNFLDDQHYEACFSSVPRYG